LIQGIQTLIGANAKPEIWPRLPGIQESIAEAFFRADSFYHRAARPRRSEDRQADPIPLVAAWQIAASFLKPIFNSAE
jgi:hypothetical protein